jgi:hypothetical protein
MAAAMVPVMGASRLAGQLTLVVTWFAKVSGGGGGGSGGGCGRGSAFIMRVATGVGKKSPGRSGEVSGNARRL